MRAFLEMNLGISASLLGSTFSFQSLIGLRAGYAALASVAGGFGALAGFFALLDDQYAGQIGEAVSIGTGIGFLPGLAAGIYIYLQSPPV